MPQPLWTLAESCGRWWMIGSDLAQSITLQMRGVLWKSQMHWKGKKSTEDVLWWTRAWGEHLELGLTWNAMPYQCPTGTPQAEYTEIWSNESSSLSQLSLLHIMQSSCLGLHTSQDRDFFIIFHEQNGNGLIFFQCLFCLKTTAFKAMARSLFSSSMEKIRISLHCVLRSNFWEATVNFKRGHTASMD